MQSLKRLFQNVVQVRCICLSTWIAWIPGVAPGVSVPAPGGLFPLDLIYMIKKISENLQVVGMDIVELCPDYDLNQNTANHASRILMEMISSLRIS